MVDLTPMLPALFEALSAVNVNVVAFRYLAGKSEKIFMTEGFAKTLGYTVDVAADGDEAARKLRAAAAAGRPHDLAILDLTVPGGMGGREILPTLRALAPDMPAIVASGYSDAPVTARPEEFGFAGALRKPVGLPELAELVAAVLARSRARTPTV